MGKADGATSPIEPKGDGCRLRILATPRASITTITGIHDGRIKLQVTAPPVDNAANNAIIRRLASILGVRRDVIKISSGEQSRRKTVDVEGITPEAARAALGL